MTTGDKIRNARTQAKMSQTELATHLKISKQLMYKYENNIVKNIPLETLQEIGRILDVDAAYLAGFSPKTDHSPLPADAYPYAPTHRIPILGRISAGLPLYAEENIEGYMYTELNHGGEYFGLRVEGDSMNAARINEGDVLVIRRQDIVEDGEIAVVLVGNDEATVKRFYRDDNIVTLMPQSYNPEHKPQVYDLRYTPVRILGKLVQNIISY